MIYVIREEVINKYLWLVRNFDSNNDVRRENKTIVHKWPFLNVWLIYLMLILKVDRSFRIGRG